MNTNSSPLYGLDESVDLQTFHSTSRETFVMFKPVQRWCELLQGTWDSDMESTYKLVEDAGKPNNPSLSIAVGIDETVGEERINFVLRNFPKVNGPVAELS